MYSLKFPEMFSINKTNLVQDKEATMSNLILLLGSEKKTLFGDPYYGTLLHKFLFEQNNQILRDIVIDEIYTSIITFMPQVRLKRSDISVYSQGTSLLAHIVCTNVLDNTQLDYTLNLFNDSSNR